MGAYDFRVGESKRLVHVLKLETPAPLSSVTAYIYDLDGAVGQTPLVDGVTGTANGGSSTFPTASDDEHEVEYLWSPGAAVRFHYLLEATIGSQTFSFEGSGAVWPRFSLLDRYRVRVESWLQTAEYASSFQGLSLLDYETVIASALDAYNTTANPDSAYVLSHTSDTVPVAIFDSLVEYAAGVALAGPLGNVAAQTNDPQQGADVVSYRDMQTRRRQQGMDMMKRAAARWGTGGLQTGVISTDSPNEYLDSFRPGWLDELEWITQ